MMDDEDRRLITAIWQFSSAQLVCPLENKPRAESARLWAEYYSQQLKERGGVVDDDQV